MKNLYKILFISLISSSLYAQMLGNSDMSRSSMEALNLINVTIGGDFPVSGTYPASRTERVDQLITRILAEYRAEVLKSTPDEQLLGMLKSKVDEFAKRNIVLKRINGEDQIVDLQKFKVTGNFDYNPYLNNDDVLIFPPLDLEKNFVYITGAVNKELKFEFVEGETLSDAIQLAFGVNPAYNNVTKASISRLSEDGSKETEFIVDISENPKLERGDRIRVLANENQKGDYSVLVLGEVKTPGRVFISKGSTMLTDVIKKVGGFTSFASLNKSTVLRGTSSEQLLKIKAYEEKFSNKESLLGSLEEKQKGLQNLENLLMIRMSDVELEDSMFFRVDNQIKNLESSVDVDFEKLFAEDDQSQDIIIKDGDVVVIPEETNMVYVFGHVNSPGYVEYRNGMTVEEYIKSAGGIGEDPRDEIKIIRSKTRSWETVTENTKVERGDYIYVPKAPTRSLEFYLRNGSIVASIAAALTTITILIYNQVNK